MKKTTLKLVLVASGVYYALLYLVTSISTPETSSPLFLLVAPLTILVLTLIIDLSYRATRPTEVSVKNPPSRKLARDVQELTKQIQVGSKASAGYFDNVLLVRLREVLVERVSLETGMEKERVRELLPSHHLGPGLLKDETLHRLLYTPPPAKGPARARMLEEIVARAEAWKP